MGTLAGIKTPPPRLKVLQLLYLSDSQLSPAHIFFFFKPHILIIFHQYSKNTTLLQSSSVVS